MGCKFCKRQIQIITPIIREEQKIVEEDDPLKFDAKKARKLVKFMLSEDNI